MSGGFPDPVSLAGPGASAHAVAELAKEITGAAFELGVLEAHLAGPATFAPGWLGRDAAAAVDQIAAVTDLAGTARAALSVGADRLEAHARLLGDAEARLVALRRQQKEDFAEARARLQVVLSAPPGAAPPPYPAEQVVAELHAGESERARVRAALLAEVEDDAVATARVLASGSAAVGGTGRPGDPARVLVSLAGLLPGWGTKELTRRAAELVARLDGRVDERDVEAVARAALPYGSATAFAAAFVSGLGASGLSWLLTLVGVGHTPPDGDVVRLLAAVLGCAPPADGKDRVQAVLDGAALDPRDPDPARDVIAIGMGEVLAAAFAGTGTPGRAALLTFWGGQILQREGTLRRSAPENPDAVRRVTGIRPGPVPDPVRTVMELLAHEGDGPAVVSVLSTPETWGAVLGRSWPGAEGTVSTVVRLAGEADGPAGDRSVVTGLGVLGGGLADGVPDGWDVDRGTVVAVSPAFGEAVGRHAAAVAGILISAAGGRTLPLSADAALRGLGVLSLDAAATRSIGAGLQQWASGEPVSPGGGGAGGIAPGVAALAGFVAVREYGQRLAYALHGFEQRGRAAEHLTDWNMFVALPVQFAPGAVGELASRIEPFLAHGLGIDGTWDNGTDGGTRFASAAAAAIVSGQLPPGQSTAADVERQASAAFRATARQLGVPEPPVPSDWNALRAFLDAGPGIQDKLRIMRSWGELGHPHIDPPE